MFASDSVERPRIPTRIHFDHLGVDQGLSQGSIFCILQDSRGYLWIGTQDGLNRYDGYGFAIFRHSPADPRSLSQHTIFAVAEDRHGVIWAGTDAGWLNAFDRTTGTFTRFAPDPHETAPSDARTTRLILEDRSGLFWVVLGDEIYTFDKESGSYSHYPTIKIKYPNRRPTVRLFEDEPGTLWYAVDGELFRFLRAEDRFEALSLPFEETGEDVEVFGFFEDEPGRLMVVSTEGVFERDPDSDTFMPWGGRRFQSSWNPRRWDIGSWLRDESGLWWMTSRSEGLYLFDLETLSYSNYRHDPRDDTTLSQDALQSIFLDRFGCMWIGADTRGLNRKDHLKGRFLPTRHNPNTDNSLMHNTVWSFWEDHNGHLWIGTDQGVDRLDRSTGTFTHFRHDPEDPESLSDSSVAAIREDGEGALWFGTRGGGLNRFDAAEEKFTHHRFVDGDDTSLASDIVQTILEDANGTLWVGTQGGLCRYDRESDSFKRYTNDPSDPTTLSASATRVLHEGPDGSFWVGTAGGLNLMDREKGTFTRFVNDPDNPHSLSYNVVHSIYEGEDGVIWVGTWGGGLNRLDPATGLFERFTQDQGLPGNVVYGVLGDDEGDLWLSTNDGLCRFYLETGAIRIYDALDGVQSSEFNAGAYYKSPGGELFFGGVSGFNAFYPELIIDNPVTPAVYLTKFLLLNQPEGAEGPLELPIHNTSEVTLSYGQNQFTLEYIALHYSCPSKNRYSYMLEGFDERWREAGSRGTATYTNLNPGEYVFRVQASNCDGVWNRGGAGLLIIIKPPWYLTWWAFTLYGIFILASLYASFFWVKHREREKALFTESKLRAEAAELQAEVAEAQSRIFQSENEQKTRELEEARNLQLSMLPRKLPEVPGLDIAVYIETANIVGGDYYDFYPDRDGSLTLAVGDATGHSTKAGIMVAIMKGLFSAWAGRTDLSAFLGRCDRILTRMQLESMYMALMLLKIQGLKVTAAGAAMPPLLLHRKRSGKVEELVVKGMFLGYNLNLPYKRLRFVLEPGDTLLVMSDGLEDLFNEKYETFDLERVKTRFAEVATRPPQQIIEHLAQAARDWKGSCPQNDDITFVVLQVAADWHELHGKAAEEQA